MDSSQRSNIIITGTSRGLGLQLAQMFISSGSCVYGCSRGKSSIDSEAYIHSVVDISDEVQVRSWIRSIKRSTDSIDVLICNAGLVESVLSLSTTSKKTFDDFLNINILGTFLVCREVSKIMAVQQHGRIIAISSTMTKLTMPGTSAYSSSKSAIEAMIKVMARELAGANVTCNVVAPGLISNDTSEVFGDDWKKRMIDQQTIKRAITTEEIYNAILFYSSRGASCVTGQVMYLGLVE